jgi:hypothetical protein
MKNTNILLIMTTLLITTSCFKDPTEPKIDIDEAIPVGRIYTLQEMKTNLPLPYTFDTAASVYATVTMDEKNGSLFKQVYVQDATDAIRLIFPETTGFSVGDSIRIYLKGKTIVNNHGTYEIQTLQPDSNVIVIANRKFIEPVDVTVDQILSRNYDLMLVRVHGVQFTNSLLGTTWADPTKEISGVSDTLEDCNKNKIVLRTSSYSAFAGQKVPCGKGSMVAIAGVYNTTMQLIVRYMSEVEMDGNRCDGTPGVCQKTVMEESFANGLGIFETFNAIGDSTWTWKQYSNEKCMEMTASTIQNEDWLISPAMDLTRIVNANLYFRHTINKVPEGVSKENMKKQQTVWVSKDYTSGDPNNATWKQCNLSDEDLPSGSNWIFVKAELPVPSEFMTEKKVRIAFKYICDESFSATWRINEVSVRGEMKE